jgi:lipoprotein signal peptidase
MDSPLNKIRHIKWVEIVLCFGITWWFWLLLTTGISRFSLPPEKVLSLKLDLYNIFVPTLICCIIGIGINYNNTDDASYHTPFLGSVLAIFGFVFIDQMIKFLLFSRFGDVMPVVTSKSYGNGYLDASILQPPVLVIVKDWVFIQPLLHKGHILQAYGIYVPGWFVLLLTVMVPFCYRYARFMKADKRLLDRSLILFAALPIGGVIDKLIYGGSIDYIRLVQSTVFDLKDMYGVLAVAVFVQSLIHNRSWQMIKRVLAFKGSLTEFKEYINCEYKVIKNIPAFFKKNSQ